MSKQRKNKKVELTPRKVKEIKTEAMGQAMILTIAYLMDELDFDEDRCLEIWEGVSRYAEAVDTKLLSMRKICDIINANTGLNIRWNV